MISLAIKNLLRRKLRTTLVIIGIFFAISFMIGLLSFSEGFLNAFNRTIDKRGADIIVSKKREGHLPLILGGGFFGKTFLKEDYKDELQKINEVELVIPTMAVFSSPTSELLFAPPLIVEGIDNKYFHKIRPYASISQGRMVTSTDKHALVLGSVVATNWNLKLGDEYEIAGKKFKIVGILSHTGTIIDFRAYTNLKSLQEVYNQEGMVDYFMIKLKDVTKTDNICKIIEKKFKELATFKVEQFLYQFKDMLVMAHAMHFIVSLFALSIGILFVASTQIWSVQERVKEFATLRTIGASKNYIFLLVILESIILTTIGGVAGCFGGVVIAHLITLILPKIIGGSFLLPEVTTRLFLIGIVTSIIIGIIAGLLPAYNISKRNIADGLKYE